MFLSYKRIFLITIMIAFSTILLIVTNSNQSSAQSPNLTNSNQSSFSGNGLFVSSKSQGYGIYQPRNSNVFSPSEDIIFYIEPSGFDYKSLRDDQGNLLYSINFMLDATLYSKNGTYLNGPLEVPFDIISHHKNKEISIDFTITQNNPFPYGDYIVKYTVHDLNSGKTFDIIKDIRISNVPVSG